MHQRHLRGKRWICIGKGRHFIEVGIPQQQGNASVLHEACKRGCVDMITALLDQGADPNLQMKVVLLCRHIRTLKTVCFAQDGSTPLHMACRHDQIELAKVLLRYGADITILDKVVAITLMLYALFVLNISFSEWQGSVRSLPILLLSEHQKDVTGEYSGMKESIEFASHHLLILWLLSRIFPTRLAFASSSRFILSSGLADFSLCCGLY